MENNVTRLRRSIPDYLSDEFQSRILARQIETRWKKEGYPFVKVWVETEVHGNRPTHVIRSNIKFCVPKD